MENKIAIHWFRRDLRLTDNAALFHSLKSGYNVQCIFIFDKEILSQLSDTKDKRVQFIHEQLESINIQLISLGACLDVRHGSPAKIWKELINDYSIAEVYTNHDYEPYAKKRDEEIKSLLKANTIDIYTFKDQVLFDRDDVVKNDGLPYTVYTTYSRRWMEKLKKEGIPNYDYEKYYSHFHLNTKSTFPSLKSIGFTKTDVNFSSHELNDNILYNYKDTRDIPGVSGTSRLSIHLRFGTISIRKLIREAQEHSLTWLNELCWREFYMMILWHFPHVAKSAFKPAYDFIQWRNNEDEFEAWCEGRTGYPIVDAGMRELNETGFMHNRVRMITASFLTKHLLIDWRWGEAYFASKLLDFDLSANNGGWQWAAGSGCDAAPYFRIFNPYLQTQRFDPDFKYIRKWVPEFEDFGYPPPIVEHAIARDRCLQVYKKGLAKK
ncbi:MAG: deoxyribodipyrimidine photo-lyase [Bacteroidetes bacterium]|nr:deoxyribodipyrimidine photo-lyase [Bacteroidota bacterium]